MVKKIFTYRGKTLEELQALKTEELIELLPARQRRSLTRGNDPRGKKLYQKIKKARESEKPMKLRTHARDVIILPDMVEITIEVYTGKEWRSVDIKPEMIGHYLGEFALSRGRISHGMPGMGATRSSLYIPLK